MHEHMSATHMDPGLHPRSPVQKTHCPHLEGARVRKGNCASQAWFKVMRKTYNTSRSSTFSKPVPHSVLLVVQVLSSQPVGEIRDTSGVRVQALKPTNGLRTPGLRLCKRSLRPEPQYR